MTDKNKELGREKLIDKLDKLEKLRFVGDELDHFEHAHHKELTFKQSKTLNIIYKKIWEYAHQIGELHKLIAQSGEKPEESTLQEVKSFDEEWTAKDWVQWAYKLGLHLDRWIWWSGVDNRKRIEEAIMEWKELKGQSLGGKNE